MAARWLLFVSHLPSQERTPRMRLWRGLRSLGSAMLRDGVYLLPARPDLADALDEHAAAIRTAGGSAQVLDCAARDDVQEHHHRRLFHRGEDYAAWHRQLEQATSRVGNLTQAQARREESALRRALEEVVRLDFFPGGDREAAEASMQAFHATVNTYFSPDEPCAASGVVTPCDAEKYQHRVWATRWQLWVDRVASAWLIRGCIDPHARFVWLASPSDCPPGAVGFDFDGAEFSHLGELVTFQVLLAAFGLDEDPALRRLGALVRYLDVGGAPIPEAAGVLALLTGARERCEDDDAFLEAAAVLLEDLRSAFRARDVVAA